jgi:hypothetical protein
LRHHWLYSSPWRAEDWGEGSIRALDEETEQRRGKEGKNGGKKKGSAETQQHQRGKGGGTHCFSSLHTGLLDFEVRLSKKESDFL